MGPLFSPPRRRSRPARHSPRWPACAPGAQKEKIAGETAEELTGAVEASLAAENDNDPTLDDRLAQSLGESLGNFGPAVFGTAASRQRGFLIVNPWSFPQQADLPVSSFVRHPQSVNVPAMGFAWIDPAAESPAAVVERKGWFGRRTPQALPPLAEESLLRNEFFEVHFDPRTGGIRAISDYHSRDPRLAQQIALWLPPGGEPGGDLNYSLMAADELKVTSAGPALGEILSRGRLLDREGHRVARFRQTTRAWRGSRIIEIEIELEIDRLPEGGPWDSYYAARFAWKDEAAKIERGTNMAKHATELMQFESPHFVNICRGKQLFGLSSLPRAAEGVGGKAATPFQQTTLLCGGLPYHRRPGPRKLDTLLVTRGETARTFRLGIAIDVPNPLAAALGFLAPPLVLPDQPPMPTPTGWLFHLDCRNVLATDWEPLSAAATTAEESRPGLPAPAEFFEQPAAQETIPPPRIRFSRSSLRNRRPQRSLRASLFPQRGFRPQNQSRRRAADGPGVFGRSHRHSLGPAPVD